MSTETIGDRIEIARRNERLTQSEFCKILNIGRTSYSHYIKGERDIPVSTLIKLFELYSIDPVWVLYGEKSEAVFQQRSDTFSTIKDIGVEIERRAAERGIKLSSDERWGVIARVYTYAIIGGPQWQTNSSKSAFLINQTLDEANHDKNKRRTGPVTV